MALKQSFISADEAAPTKMSNAQHGYKEEVLALVNASHPPSSSSSHCPPSPHTRDCPSSSIVDSSHKPKAAHEPKHHRHLPSLPSPSEPPSASSRPFVRRHHQHHPTRGVASPPPTPSHSSKALDHGDYDWKPILLLTPPCSSHSTRRISLPPSARNTPGCNFNPRSDPLLRLDGNADWLDSPTLSTRKARKLSHPSPVPLSSTGISLDSAMSNDASHTGSTNPFPPSPRSPRTTKHLKSLSTLDDPARAENVPQRSRKIGLPTKPRALTLDGSGRPVLPPLFTNSSPSHIGPIRASPFSSLASRRHGAEHRHNPYFVSTPARRSSENLLLPSLRHDGRDTAMWSAFRIPRTPTSSLRSTSNEQDYMEVGATSYPSIHTALLPQLQDSSLKHGLEAKAKTMEGHGSDSLEANGSLMPSSHLALPGNALGLYLEPAPFPSELMLLDHGDSIHGRLSSRSEADYFLYQNGSSTNFLDANRKTISRAFDRSPVAVSEASSLTVSPSSSDDSLATFPLGHRHQLNATDGDSKLALPPLRLEEALHKASISPATSKPVSNAKDSSFLYSMPVLRAMSPFADMSSDSDDEEEQHEPHEPHAGPSTSRGPTAIIENTSKGMDRSTTSAVPQEGHTGEIFANSKSVLPLTVKDTRANTPPKLFCKLDSTSHHCFSGVDGKWACYRRNYLKIDVSFHFEDEQGHRRDTAPGDLVCKPDSRPAFVVERFAVHMTAHVINEDGRLQRGRQGLVPLIQFGPARERGPREPVQPVELRSGGTIVRDSSANEQAAARAGNIAAFRRVQIRSATMNNGQRGAASQQFYALKLTLLAYPKGATGVAGGTEVASSTSHPITVRGRSKVHYAPAAGAKGGAAGGSSSSVATGTKSKEHSKKRDTHRRSGSHRRSTRLRGASEEVDVMQDADDEGDGAAQRSIKTVMDIRSII